MRTLVTALVTAATALATPAGAQALTDTFNGEAGGATVLNYTAFTNFNVTAGSVDLVAQGYAGLNCFGGTGSCVDLGGSLPSGNAGELTSKLGYAYNAGDTIRLSFQLSGNQRPGSDPDGDTFGSGFIFGTNTTLLNYGYNSFGSDTIVFPSILAQSISSSFAIGSSDPFALRSLFFTASSAGSVRFRIFGNADGDPFGPILDQVSLTVTPAVVGVPEPASWALMISGFGLVGAAARRRRHLHPQTA